MDTPGVKTEKACNDCHKVKPLGDFYKRRSAIDGHFNSCRECMLAYTKQWYVDNPGRRAVSDKKYYDKMKELKK